MNEVSNSKQDKFVMVMSDEVRMNAEGMGLNLTRQQINEITEKVLNDNNLWKIFNEGVAEIIESHLKGE